MGIEIPARPYLRPALDEAAVARYSPCLECEYFTSGADPQHHPWCRTGRVLALGPRATTIRPRPGLDYTDVNEAIDDLRKAAVAHRTGRLRASVEVSVSS